MLITTSNNFEGHKITDYKGIVTGEAVMGANVVKDVFAGVRDIVGGRSAAYEKELRKARDAAIAEASNNAEALGANGIVGVDLDYESLGKDGGMLMVTISGTAVVVG